MRKSAKAIIIFLILFFTMCNITHLFAAESTEDDCIIYNEKCNNIQDKHIYILMHSGGHRANEYENKNVISWFEDDIVCSLDYTQWGFLLEDYDNTAEYIINNIIPELKELGANTSRENISIIGISQGARYISEMIPNLIPYIKTYGILSCSQNEESAKQAVLKNKNNPINVYYCASVEEMWGCRHGYEALSNIANCKLKQTVYGHTWRTWDIGLKEFIEWHEELTTQIPNKKMNNTFFYTEY